MRNVKYLPGYEEDKEVFLSTIKAGETFLLRINGEHCVYMMCKVGNTPLQLNCLVQQPNKNLLVTNLVTGRVVNKHPSQLVVPATVKINVRVERRGAAGSN